MKKKINRLLMTVSIWGLVFTCYTIRSQAQVTTTKEPAGPADSIYVAGNPDLYPIEYYNEDSGCYEGLFPQMLERVSDKIGKDFVYISAGRQNRQKNLAKSCQVEMISVHLADQYHVQDSETQTLLLTVELEGKTTEIYISFTEIASGELVSQICSVLDQFSDAEIAEMTLSYVIGHQKEKFPAEYLLAALTLLGLLCLGLLIYIFRQHRYKMRKEKDRMSDSLTGIGNGRYLAYHFDHYISSAASDLYYMVYFGTDIDHICQYQGETESNEFQRYAASVLSSAADDGEVAARLEDGAFAMLIQENTVENAEDRVKELLLILNRFSEKLSKEYTARFHAGLYPLGHEKGNCEETVFSARQGYLYAQKHNQPYAFSNQKLLNEAKKTPLLQLELQNAIKNKEFRLYLQFIVDKHSKQICGAEALSRWQHPREGILNPGQYIGLIHKAGITDKLDFFILEEVCKQLVTWKQQGYSHLMITCNFTRTSISKDSFLEHFTEIISQYEFDHRKLWIEITEDSFSDNDQQIFENISECKKMGFFIVLDDFGSGYSSLRDLCDYPVDCIKLDRDIIKKCVEPKGRALLNGICTLAQELNLQVLFEGVESKEENRVVSKASGQYIQGFYYSRVLPKEHAMEYYQKYTALP